jgi:hypothetical protein
MPVNPVSETVVAPIDTLVFVVTVPVAVPAVEPTTGGTKVKVSNCPFWATINE